MCTPTSRRPSRCTRTATTRTPEPCCARRPEQLRVEWGACDQGGYSGWLQVAGLDSGASEVTVHLSFFDDSRDPGRQSVHDALTPACDAWRNR
ncbi:hypothetical protein SALBM311S_04804 [Streptomyces alboniger]